MGKHILITGGAGSIGAALRRALERRWSRVGGTRDVLAAAGEAAQPPWVLLASSREVHGEPAEWPVTEDAAIRSVNTYGRSKERASQRALAAEVIES